MGFYPFRGPDASSTLRQSYRIAPRTGKSARLKERDDSAKSHGSDACLGENSAFWWAKPVQFWNCHLGIWLKKRRSEGIFFRLWSGTGRWCAGDLHSIRADDSNPA